MEANGKKWIKLSKALTGHKCSVCGRALFEKSATYEGSWHNGKPYQIKHHLIPQKYNGNGDTKNLIIICNTCHGKLHALYETKAIEMAMLANPNFFQDCYFYLKTKYNILEIDFTYA